MKKQIKDVKYGYMCKVDFDFELGAALGGNRIFPSIKDLKEHCSCIDEDGIVKVSVGLVKLIKKGCIKIE